MPSEKSWCRHHYLSQCRLTINNKLQNNHQQEFCKETWTAYNHKTAFIYSLWGIPHGIYMSKQTRIMLYSETLYLFYWDTLITYIWIQWLINHAEIYFRFLYGFLWIFLIFIWYPWLKRSPQQHFCHLSADSSEPSADSLLGRYIDTFKTEQKTLRTIFLSW